MGIGRSGKIRRKNVEVVGRGEKNVEVISGRKGNTSFFGKDDRC